MTCLKNQSTFYDLATSTTISTKQLVCIVKSYAGITSSTPRTQCTYCDSHVSIAMAITLHMWFTIPMHVLH